MDTQTPEAHAINIIDLTNSLEKNAGDLNKNTPMNAAEAAEMPVLELSRQNGV